SDRVTRQSGQRRLERVDVVLGGSLVGPERSFAEGLLRPCIISCGDEGFTLEEPQFGLVRTAATMEFNRLVRETDGFFVLAFGLRGEAKVEVRVRVGRLAEFFHLRDERPDLRG